jgi:hypothetical protein
MSEDRRRNVTLVLLASLLALAAGVGAVVVAVVLAAQTI